MEWIDVSLKVALCDAEKAEDIISSFSEYGIYIEDYSELEKETLEIAHIDLIEEELLKKDRENVIVHIYLPAGDNINESLSAIEEKLKSAGIAFTENTDCIKQEDWANNWKKYFHQLNIGGKMLICPSWEKAENPENRAVLYLEPGMAFGTGTHATTCLCMEVMEKYIGENSTVLDIGCGSGILALSAMLLGAESALGVDIDEKAVKTARENAERNGFKEPEIKFIEGDLTEKVSGKYNIVLANIVADVIVILCDSVSRFMSEDSLFIVSGIIKESEGQVKDAFAKNNLEIIERGEKAGWLSFVLKQKAH